MYWFCFISLILSQTCSVLGETKHVVLTFQYVNGSWVAVVPPAPPPTYTLSTKVIAAIFLFIVFFISFAGNVLIISTVGSSLTLRRLPYNILLLQVGVTGLVEATLNVSLSTAYLLTQPWRMGRTVCQLNSFLMEVVPMVHTISLVMLMVNRTRAVNNTTNKYKKIDGKLGRVKLLLTLVWFVCLVLGSPVLLGLIESWPFPLRYSCNLMHEFAPYYGAVTALVCYVVPWVAFLICSIVIFRAVQGEKKKEEKAARGQAPANNKLSPNTAAFIASNQMWHELRNVLMVTILLMLYIILWVPYIIMVKADQIRQKWSPYNLDIYRNLTHTYYQEEAPMETTTMDPSEEPMIKTRHHMVDPETNLTLHDPGYWEVPEVKEGKIHETVFVWLRFIHCAIVPIVIFILNKDIRKKGTALLYCCGSTRATSNTPRPISALLHRQSLEVNRQKQMNKFKLTNYHVPVLFATNEGLYLRILDRETAVPSQDKHQDINKNMWNIEPEFVTELCDTKIEGPRSVPQFTESNVNDKTMILEEKPDTKDLEDMDEGFHETNSDKELLLNENKRKKVQFRNTVVEIGKKIESRTDSGLSRNSETAELRVHKDPHKRKSTGRETRLDQNRDANGGRSHSRADGDHRRGKRKEERMERRFSDHQEGQYSGKRKSSYKRRKSDPIIDKEKLELETITTIDARYGILK